VTHVEEAEQVAREPRRRFAWNVAWVLVLLFGLALVLLVWHDLQLRAETAETSAASLAQQVQTECETNGELRIDGRDLCDQADEVAENVPAEALPGPQGERGPAGVQGAQGRTGPGPTAAQIAAAVDDWCKAGMCKGEDGEDSTVPGPTGEPGQDSTVPGPMGPAGPAGADSTVPGPPGVHGEQGPAGPAGQDGRGVQSVTCQEDGSWLITYTDGATSTTDGPCRVGLPASE